LVKVIGFLSTDKKNTMRFYLFLLLAPFYIFLGHAQENSTSQIENYITSKEYSKAIGLVKKQLEKNNTPKLREQLGELYAFQGNWDKAIPVFEKLKKEYPQNADYWFKYGGVLAKKAQNSNKFIALTLIGRIKSSFVKAAELDSQHIDSRWALVDVYLSLPGIFGGGISKAEILAKELKDISLLDGYLALGYVYEYDDEKEKAKESYYNGLNYLAKTDEIKRNQLHYQIGKVCGDYGVMVDAGIAHMQTFIDNYTVKDGVTQEWIYYRLARLYRQKNNKEKAKNWIQKALAVNDNFDLAIKEKERIAMM